MIARCAILLAALFSAGDVFSRSLDSISSCDNRFIIFHRDNYGITLKGKRKSSKIYLGHDLNGGSIDPVASMFVVYGLPKNINLDSPQMMTVSQFSKILIDPKSLKKITSVEVYMQRHLVRIIDLLL
jgi:hypothetical protein